MLPQEMAIISVCKYTIAQGFESQIVLESVVAWDYYVGGLPSPAEQSEIKESENQTETILASIVWYQISGSENQSGTLLVAAESTNLVLDLFSNLEIFYF